MKIVLWPLHYLPVVGGAEMQVHCLALELQKLGHEVIAIANHLTDSIVKEYYEGIPVFRFPFISAITKCDLQTVKKIFEQVSEVLTSFSPDVVNTHALVDPLNFYQNRLVKTPLCVTTHGGLIEAQHCNKPECLKLCAKAHQISAPAQNFLDLLPIQHNSFRVIPNGLPIASTPIQPLPKNPTIAAIGRFVPEKGFDTALYAVKELIPKYSDLKLLLIGDGPEWNFLSKQIDALDLHTFVEKIGIIPPRQIHHFIDQAQIIFIPSTHECLNLVAIETAMRGRPAIASDIPGLKEIIEHGVTGFLVEPCNPKLLAKQADLLLSNHNLIEQMGQKAFSKACLQFSLETTVQNYIRMYYDAIHAYC